MLTFQQRILQNIEMASYKQEGLKGAAAAVASSVSDLLASIRGGAKEEVGVASLAKLHRDLLTA